MKFLDVLAVLGALIGVGTAMDFAVRDSAKRNFTVWLGKVAAANSNYSYNGTSFLDKIFGRGLLSLGASIRYVTISLMSMCISYGFAYFTTADSSTNGTSLFPSGISLLPFLVLLICVLFSALGDIASYSITRLFIRTVDSYRSRVVSLGLVVADIITSLSLFFISFSFARIISYIIIIQFSSVPIVRSDTSYIQEMVGEGVRLAGAYPVAGSSLRSTSLAVSIAHDESTGELVATAILVRNSDFKSKEDLKRYRFVRYEAIRGCVTPDLQYSELVLAQNNTKNLLVSFANEQNDLRAEKITQGQLDVIASKFSDESKLSGCEMHFVTIRRGASVNGLVAIAGPMNTYLASAERTLYDAYSITGFKLSPYVYFDPYESMGEFITSLNVMTSSTFLGMTEPEQKRVEVFSYLSPPSCMVCGAKGESKVHVPFSPMAASSLTSSLFFLGYLATLGIAVVRRWINSFIIWCAPRFDLDKAVFTTVGLTFCVIFSSLIILESIFTFAWEVAFH